MMWWSNEGRRSGTGIVSRGWLGASLLALSSIVPLACPPGALAAQAPGAREATATAVFSTPPAGTKEPFGRTALDLSAKGYVEQEFFVAGKANRYRIKDPLKTAEIVDRDNPYLTRILVRRPTDPRKFNGRVFVEWFNVTTDQDVDFFFSAIHEKLLDEGYAWVGVSAQRGGVDALKTSNPARYGRLTLAAGNGDPLGGELDEKSDVLAWDVYAQIAAALRMAPGAVDPLGGLRPKLVIAAGESQSAQRLSRYYNTILPHHRDVFDAYFLYDRLIGGMRTDLGKKMLTFGSETLHNYAGAAPADNANLRVWEVAGASHLSYEELSRYIDEQILRNGVTRLPDGRASNLTQTLVGCGTYPLWSRVRNADALDAGLDALMAWVTKGVPPASAERFRMDAAGKLYRDGDGRVGGGVRLAAYDAPIAKNMGANTGPGFCMLPGSHQDFTPKELCSRYQSQAGYVSRVVAVTDAARRRGFLTRADATRTIDEAKTLKLACPAG